MSAVENVNVVQISWLLLDPPVPCPDVLTEMEVAQYLRIWKKMPTPGEQERMDRKCKAFIRSLVDIGDLVSFVAGGQRRFMRTDVEDMVRLRRRTPGWRERTKERHAQYANRPQPKGARFTSPFKEAKKITDLDEEAVGADDQPDARGVDETKQEAGK